MRPNVNKRKAITHNKTLGAFSTDLSKLVYALFLFVLALLPQALIAGELYLDGTYQGENIYMQNQFNKTANSFCIKEVYVNNKPFTDINTSAFEIPLDEYKIGDYVSIKIVHKDYCKPRVLNSDVLRSKSTFEIVSFKAESGQLKWTTKNESSHEPFTIEQFRNSKWVPIGKMPGKGPEGFNQYALPVNHHSGVNKYRIRQKDLGNRSRYSPPMEYISDKKPITYYPKRIDKDLYLSEITPYEIYDSFGRAVKVGEGKHINVADLEPGIYYLNIDNRTEKFLKK